LARLSAAWKRITPRLAVTASNNTLIRIVVSL
jgi:hypothetical protein